MYRQAIEELRTWTGSFEKIVEADSAKIQRQYGDFHGLRDKVPPLLKFPHLDCTLQRSRMEDAGKSMCQLGILTGSRLTCSKSHVMLVKGGTVAIHRMASDSSSRHL